MKSLKTKDGWEFVSVLLVQDHFIFQLRDFPLVSRLCFQFYLDSEFYFRLIEMFSYGIRFQFVIALLYSVFLPAALLLKQF